MRITLLRPWLIGTLLALFLSSAVLVSFWFKHWLYSEAAISESHRIIKIERGQSLYSVADLLEEKGLMSHPELWVYYARFIKKTDIKAGEYALKDVESPFSLLVKFESGSVVQHKLTFIEGSSASDALATLFYQENIRKTLPEDFSVDKPLSLDSDISHLEGWLYPDTYFYSSGDSDRSVLSRARKKMLRVLEEEWQARMPGLPLDSAYEALILASIVEKETGAPHERSEIAGVFIRRLQKGMRLQTDPTVIYGMGENYNGNITRADLRRPTAYNTYVINGLPPTPIALPGRAAIHAVLNPKDGDSLYFVAKGDGTHYFSSSLDEHNDAVRRYQLSRRENYRSHYDSDNED